MHGPAILARSLSVAVPMGAKKELWQYHSRSDRHSKIGCWAILFDLLRSSKLLVSQVLDGEIGFGINHELVDFGLNRRKNLDLVLCTPRSLAEGERDAKHTFRSLVNHYGIVLDAKERRELEQLPDITNVPVGSVRLALEAKAAMTAHSKARPRLYDELNSSHLTVHGASDLAIAAGFVMVNVSPTFISSDMNKSPGARENVTKHKQPNDAITIMDKVKEIRRRTKTGEDGFDALAIIVVDCANDGSPVTIVSKPPAPAAGEIFHYEAMIHRVQQIYESRFA